MEAEKLLADGDLDGALELLQQRVRKDPADAKLRVFLFQLLCVLGQWERAHTQLNVAGEMDPANLPMTQTYREALRQEVLRRKVFAGERSPMVFGDPEEWLAHLMEALRLAADDRSAESATMRDRAFEAAPATGGTLNGEAFEWIADADPRLGPVLEAVVNGRYYWIPFHRIQQIAFEEPEDLRDMVWTPAQFTWTNGGQAVGLIPTRYPGSEVHDDPAIRLARKTDWVDRGSDLYLGLGQRMLATDQGEHPLLEVREIKLNG